MTFTPKLEIDLSSDGAPGWVDISSDVLSDEQIRWEYGIRSPRIDDRVASTGQFGFVLDNKNRKFSPNSTDCLAGFEIGNRVRLSFYGTNGADSDYTLTPTTDVSYATTDFGGGLAHAFSSNKAGSMAYALYSTDAMASTNQLPYRDMSLSVWVKMSTDQTFTTDTMPANVVSFLTKNKEASSDGSRLLNLVIYSSDRVAFRAKTTGGSSVSDLYASDVNVDLTSWNNYIFSQSETSNTFTVYRNGTVLLTSTTVDMSTDAVLGQFIQVFGTTLDEAKFTWYASDHGFASDGILWDYATDNGFTYTGFSTPAYATDNGYNSDGLVGLSGTGGTKTAVGTDTLHTYTVVGTDTFIAVGVGTVQYLVVAGGGGGGNGAGGGGGAGGYLTSDVALVAGTYGVAVGGGGNGGTVFGTDGTSGGNSIFSTCTATGGGGGGSATTGKTGGSGGGASSADSTGRNGAAGTAGQGTAGGNSQAGAPNYTGGGGGGATAAGTNGAATVGGAGGTGTASSISGASVTYAGGGGGGTYNGGTAGTATGGGGAGSNTPAANGTAGTDNTGGGGGGGARNADGSSNSNGGNGGSGIVIVRYPSPSYATDAGYDSNGVIAGTYATNAGYDSDLGRKVNSYSSAIGFDSNGILYSCNGAGPIGSVAHLALYDRALTDDDAFAIYSVREFQEDLLYVLENGAPTHYWALAAGKRNALHTASADVFNKFTGTIADIQPEADRGGNRICKISAADWIDKAARFRATSIPIQVEQPSGTVVETMLAYTNIPPADFDIGTGLNTFTYAANAAKDNQTLLGELGRLTKSEPGYSYISGGATSDGVIGEQFVFEDRAFRQQNTTSKLTLNDDGTSDAMVDLRLFRSIQQLYNRVKTTVHPTTVDANAVVIYSLSTTVTPELPGGVATVLSLAYTDSDSAFETIGAVDVVSPERNTDYTVETALTGGSQVDNDIRQTILNTKSSDCIAYWTLYDTGSIAIRDERQSNSRGDGSGGGDGGSTDPGSNYSSGTSSSMCVKPVSRYEAFK